MRNWTATIVVTSSWLISGFIASQPLTSLADNGVTSSESISQSRNTQPITLNTTEFGVLKVNSKGQSYFTPTRRILLSQGGKYGWRIQLKNYKGKVTWREIMRLPKPPETWATDDGGSLSL